MKILLTGANGFIGSNIYERLEKDGHEVLGVVRERGKDCTRRNIVVADLKDELLIDFVPEAIIHTAARGPYPGTSFEQYVNDNIIATQNVVNFAIRKDIKKIIYMGAVSSYGYVEGVLKEDTPHNNPSDYGLTKLVAEKIVRNSSVPNYILILPGVVGKGGKNCWLTNTIYGLINNQPLEIYNPDGWFNNVVYIEDMYLFIRKIIEENLSEGSKTAILAAQERMVVKDMIEYLKGKSLSKSEISYIETKKGFYIDCFQATKKGYRATPLRKVLDNAFEMIFEENMRR